jgi:hypothetical protein
MNMLIGGGVGGRFSRPIFGITAYENRILQNDEHKYFWQDSKYCIDNNIYLIVNIDTYLTGGRWQPTNEDLRQFTINTKTRLKSLGATKSNCRFTVDNESNEYCDFNYYMNMVRVIHDALNGDFELGAGNFHTTKIDWYEALAMQYIGGHYEILDFHMQDGLDSESDIDNYIKFMLMLKQVYNLRIAVTEGNNFYNVSTANGHELLKYQINKADEIGAEQFCFPYVNWTSNNEESHEGMSYCVNDRWVTDYWNNMVNLIISKKPTQRSEDGMILPSTKLGSTGYLAELVEELLIVLGYDIGKIDGVFNSTDVTELKKFQYAIKGKYPNIDVDGICGRKCYFYLIEELEDPIVRDEYFRKINIYASPVK